MPRVPSAESTNHLFDARVQAIMQLIAGHMSFATLKKFHRPISLAGGPFAPVYPACYVQPESWDPTLVTNAKYECWGQVSIIVYVTNNDPDACGEEAMNAQSQLEKLLSNNAAGDLQTPAPTYQYFQYPGYWIQSKYGPAEVSEILSFQREATEQFFARVTAQFRFYDVLIH